MKKMMKKTAAILFSIVFIFSMLTAAVPTAFAAQSTVELTYSGSNSQNGVLDQYVTRDNSKVKLVNGRTLYSYDIASKSFSVEYTFPEMTNSSPNGPQYGSYYPYTSGAFDAYINNDKGLLYFAYDKYQNLFARESMSIEVITYDLESARKVSSFEVQGEILLSVGADNSGNVYIGTNDRFGSAFGNKADLLVFNKSGKKLASFGGTDYIDDFCGFADDGGFCYAKTVHTPAAQSGYYYVNRYVGIGNFNGKSITFSETPVINSLRNYKEPALLIGDSILSCTGKFYHMDGNAYDEYKTAAASDSSAYLNHSGVTAVVEDNLIYVQTADNTIICYDMQSGNPVSAAQTQGNVFNFFRCADGFIALIKNGTSYSYEFIGADSFVAADKKVINLNELSIYQKTTAEIVQKFAEAAPEDYNAQFYAQTGSVASPYKEFVLTDTTKKNAVKIANYYRWLGGLSELSAADSDVWSRAAKGAVLTQRNVALTGTLSHYPEQPSDMDDSFYQGAYKATSSSNLAYGYSGGQAGLIATMRAFMNDDDDRNRTIPGHRDTFMQRNGVSFAAGFTSVAGVHTIGYKDDPNASGMVSAGNNAAAYTWPAAGNFPAEEINTTAMWTINLNTAVASLSRNSVYVTITDLQTGEVMERTPEDGLYATSYWGRIFSFNPPKADSYEGKSYLVELHNLADSIGTPTTLEYTVNFFSYADPVEVDGAIYIADEYGRLTEIREIGDADMNGKLNVDDVTYLQRHLARFLRNNGEALIDESNSRIVELCDVDGNGSLSINDVTELQRKLAGYKTASKN